MKYWIATAVLMAAASVLADYVDEVTADGPEAMYCFNEAAGATTLSDASGNDHDSLSMSNVTFGATGPVDSAAVFSNGTARLDLQLDPSAGDFSIEAVIRFDASGQSRTIFQQEDGDGNGRAVFYRTSGGYLRSYLGGSATTSSGTVPDGEWHHIAMTVEENGSTDVIRFYIDGEAAGSGTVNIESANGDWLLGNGSLNGAIDELAVYDSLLSAEQILDHYSWLTAGDEYAGDSPVHYVSRSGTSVYPYTNWTTAARYIQQAVDAAAAGDTVLVTNGTYASGAQITVSRAITIASLNGPEVTIVDGQNNHRCFNLGSAACTLSGFTIQNGDSGDGGGVYCGNTTPQITHCVLSGNSADNRGGGSYYGTLTHCTLSGNTAVWYGGGSYYGTLTHCTLSGNSAYGGGGSSWGTLTYCTLTGNSAETGGGSFYGTLRYCTLTGNSAETGGGSYYGTLTYCTLSGNTAVDNAGGSYWGSLRYCTLTGNSADNKGGGSFYGTLRHCTLTGNSAVSSGGGSYYGTLTHCTLSGNSAVSSGGGSCWGTLRHCTLTGNSADNEGGGSSCGTLTHCTLIGNSASQKGGGSCYGTLKNCILWGNSAGNSWDNVYESTITYSCWPESTNGTGNISSNPLLASGHLLADSPCIDAGLPNVTSVTEDPDGTPVPLDGDGDGTALPDMGAYEYLSYSADMDGDGLSDAAEVYTYGTDLANADTDGDGRSDGDEVAAGTSPTYDESVVIADAVAGVTNNPSAYGLYSTNTIADLAMGGVMIQPSNGWVRLNLQLEQCTDLGDGTWTNAGDAVNWQLEARDGSMYYRVRGGE